MYTARGTGGGGRSYLTTASQPRFTVTLPERLIVRSGHEEVEENEKLRVLPIDRTSHSSPSSSAVNMYCNSCEKKKTVFCIAFLSASS